MAFLSSLLSSREFPFIRQMAHAYKSEMMCLEPGKHTCVHLENLGCEMSIRDQRYKYKLQMLIYGQSQAAQ